MPETRYQVCPRCKELVSETQIQCPHCGMEFTVSRLVAERSEYWCPSCGEYVKPLIDDYGEAWLPSIHVTGLKLHEALKEDAARIREASVTRVHCPRCGGANLLTRKPQESPLAVLKLRLAHGEVTPEEYEKISRLLDGSGKDMSR